VIIILLVLFVFSLFIEGSFLFPLLPSAVIPDFLLISTVCIAFLWDEKKGALLGFAVGLIQDILFSPAIGYFALTKMLIGYLAGLMGKAIYREQIIAPVFLTFMFTFFHEGALYFLVERFIGVGFSLRWIVRLLFIPKAFIHLVFALLLYPLFYRAEQKKIASGSHHISS
jgi:rod shape-determining protein MreD